MIKPRNNKTQITTSLGMLNEAVGDHGLTFRKIFSLIDSIFRNKFVVKGVCENAGKLLYISQNIRIKDYEFYKVRLGDDINVLITYDYLGKENNDYVLDFAIVDGAPTIFIFANALVNENIPRAIRTFRLHTIFSTLVDLYANMKYTNIIGSIYEHINLYAPMVLTVRLIETYYNRTFNMEKDYSARLFENTFTDAWFNEDALDIIHSCSDSALLDFGAMIEHVSRIRYKIEVGDDIEE